jgi:hypothetical protein
MEQLNPSDLKAILHSKRANLYYLEHARVMQKMVEFYISQKPKMKTNIGIFQSPIPRSFYWVQVHRLPKLQCGCSPVQECWSVLQVVVERLYLWGAKLNG